MDLDWSKIEFEVFVLLYAAHCNFIETTEERAYILSKVDESIFNKMHTEIAVGSDRENIDKIQDYLSENSYSTEDKTGLIKDIKEVFFADGTVDEMEKKVFMLLKKLLS